MERSRAAPSAGELKPPSAIESEIDARLLQARVSDALFGSSAKATAPLTLGRFTILDRLGSGAMGTVYAAFDPERGANVALKLLTRTDAIGVYRIKREFRSLSRLAHPNLVTLHELFQAHGCWFFSMQLVPGVRFDDWIRGAEPSQREARLRAMTLQLARAVGAIHDAGKLHCDLKPSNVRVTPEGRVVVLDFGLVSESSLAGEGHSSPIEIAGTPGYMAPEQAAGKPPTTASDWYAVGVMLFEALTGRLPFAGTPSQIIADKQRLDAPDPR
ncbi:MAG TPA: serine/threonine-protein kinase, partial [Polyangiaceae bacterium]|nr:serine/threonine-protein kinase [Polyangiaceae bacterium]